MEHEYSRARRIEGYLEQHSKNAREAVNAALKMSPPEREKHYSELRYLYPPGVAEKIEAKVNRIERKRTRTHGIEM